MSEYTSRYDAPKFHGESYDPEKHEKRLTRQLDRVRSYLMAHPSGVTLRDISDHCNCSEASASARVRDVRREGKECGLWRIDKKEIRDGLWIYALVIGGEGEPATS